MARRLALLALALGALLSGCGMTKQHFESQSPNGIPDGPGLLSGDEGAFVIYSDKKRNKAAPPESGSVASDNDTATNTPADQAEYREFRDYQAFQRWKRAARGTEAYREFQDWRRWKAYQRWEQRQAQ